MNKKAVLKISLIMTLVLIFNFTFTHLEQKKIHYIAGDDLPLYIGTSAPRG